MSIDRNNRNIAVWVPLAALATVTMLIGGQSAARAQIVSDPANDFLGTYTGPQGGDLDVTGVGVTFDGTNFTLTSTFNAAVGTTAGAFYVWGVDRGAGTVGFPTLAPGVTFDTVILLRPGGNSTVGGNTLTNVTFTGNTLTAIVPVAFLPQTTAKTPNQYTFNLWPRITGVAGNASISDFAPNNSNISVAAPEPSSFALLFGALAPLGVGLAYRGTRRSAP